MYLPEALPAVGVRHVEQLLGAGDSDEEQAPLFFDVRFVIICSQQGQHSVFDPGDDHHGKFQALGRVQRHHADAVFLLVPAVDVSEDRGQLQEVGQRTLRMVSIVFNRGSKQLADVRLALLRFFVARFLEHALVAGLPQYGAEDALDRFLPRLADLPVDLSEAVERLALTGGEEVVELLAEDDVEKSPAKLTCDALQAGDRSLAHAPRRHVDDSLEALAVPGVVKDSQEAEQILDLLAQEELDAANDGIGDIGVDQLLFEGP